MLTLNNVPEAVSGGVAAGGDGSDRALRWDDGSWLLDGGLPPDEVCALLAIDALPGEDEGEDETLGGFAMAVSAASPPPATPPTGPATASGGSTWTATGSTRCSPRRTWRGTGPHCRGPKLGDGSAKRAPTSVMAAANPPAPGTATPIPGRSRTVHVRVRRIAQEPSPHTA
ncbi:MAG: hypothetical protein AVDCRST_MAG19-3459 [uncultured Thermomicrobiales bacterium]|uniref:Uncharacterized protein n=1 Tax=uncultured Thermomicrobiales bacterium TaxID=1645740 RepID=A0A6J4VGG4_9BACT|nr:MAG: hypothetical protein AVDCRST_MAG19-3459 [uncultured Thermomicrobiales bacterium]